MGVGVGGRRRHVWTLHGSRQVGVRVRGSGCAELRRCGRSLRGSQRLVEEGGQRRVEERDDGHVGAGLQVEGVDLGAQPGRDGRVVDRLEARAVDVPDAALPDVS